MLTRRERLMLTLRGELVDRPAVSFYEIGGFKVDPQDPDPFNIYNAPDWRGLLQLAEQRTDLIRMMSPVRARSVDPTGSASSQLQREFFKEESCKRDNSLLTRTTVTAAGRTMTQTTRRDRDLDTVWTTEHLLKNTDDLKAYLQIPDEAFAETVDVSAIEAEEAELGDRGIVMIDTEDPLCAAASLWSMEDYTIIAMTEPALFHQLLEKMARRIHERTQLVSGLLPGRLWRIYGPEYATPPYLPTHLFEQYVVRYAGRGPGAAGPTPQGQRLPRPGRLPGAAWSTPGPRRCGVLAGAHRPTARRSGTLTRRTSLKDRRVIVPHAVRIMNPRRWLAASGPRRSSASM